jgi:para-nitrobenzyl esterase
MAGFIPRSHHRRWQMRKLVPWLAGAASAGLLLAAGSAVTAPVAAAAGAPPDGEARIRVHVESGDLAGVERDGVSVFQGVPYAAPPVGALRWQPPHPPLPWSGEREARTPGAACMQRHGGLGAATGIDRMSEDCLTLVVFAPKAAQRAPVMVWLHGGANIQGTGSKAYYDGSAFARDGVVMVAINYRLGPLGFFAHPALTRSAKPDEPLANYGLMDQLAALRWVARNIAAFGGDPQNVTLFGESAGGHDALALMAAPAARGTFVRAIAESPGGGWYPLPALADAETQGERLVGRAGLPANATAAQLLALPAERLIAEMDEGQGPALDGRFLSESPTWAFARGHSAALPLMLGSNSYEASLDPHPEAMVARASAATRAAYAGSGGGAADTVKLGAALFTDQLFGAPVRWFARQAAQRGPVWLYHFSYVRVRQRGTLPGASHGSEIPYVFDSWDRISRLAALLPAEDRAMTALVHSCWVSFAKTGAPVCQGAPPWPAYTPASDELLELGTPVAVRQHFRQQQLDAQERAAAAILGAAAR